MFTNSTDDKSTGFGIRQVKVKACWKVFIQSKDNIEFK